jgi:RNA polymerase sigma-70 factor (ECF subfamily)
MLTFQELYETYAVDVYRFALWLTGDPFESEDLTSETFVRAWAHNNTIRTETLKAYLFTIARNFYLEKERKGKRLVSLEETYQDPAPGPEVIVEAIYELNRIRRFLSTLPEVDRSAFVLRVQHGLPYSEIARVLDLSLPAARVKVHRIRKKLLISSLNKEVP